MQNIAIIYGGKSCESEISVLTALSVFSAVEKKYAAELVYLKDGRFYVGKKLQKIDSYRDFSIKGLKKVTFINGKMYCSGFPRRAKKIDCAGRYPYCSSSLPIPSTCRNYRVVRDAVSGCS